MRGGRATHPGNVLGLAEPALRLGNVLFRRLDPVRCQLLDLLTPVRRVDEARAHLQWEMEARSCEVEAGAGEKGACRVAADSLVTELDGDRSRKHVARAFGGVVQHLRGERGRAEVKARSRARSRRDRTSVGVA